MLLVLYCLAALVVIGGCADFWDDFSNNLASDLAPFVSLFGEQTTKQYLSESITYLDYFIFAMAPIGIITSVVSVIRVCGSPSLRALIGRAQEGGGVAEAELCSSTSRDVCELYNNGGIVRVFGRPKILEVVHDPNPDSSSPSESAGIYVFDEYVETSNGTKEWELKKSPDPESWLGETGPYAPNLSHNVGIKRPDEWVFVLVALLGFCLQGGVLIFATVATYYFRWEKDGEQPEPYACILVIIGITMVCAGMYLCAYLVGQSTQERIFRRQKSNIQRSSIIWLQPRQMLGDQMFDPFCYVDDGGQNSMQQYTTSWKGLNKTPGFAVWLAVGVSVAGFVVQFVGLRGVHSAISVAQLGAALLMSGVRSMLRMQRLSTKDNQLSEYPEEIDGYELDWLALRIVERDIKAALPAGPCGRCCHFFWRFSGMARGQKGVTYRVPGNMNHETAVTKTLAYRSRLASLTDAETVYPDAAYGNSQYFATEMVLVRGAARKLVLAIESAANKMLSAVDASSKWRQKNAMFWAISCRLSSRSCFDTRNQRNEPDDSIVYLKLTRASVGQGHEDNFWKLENSHDLEAVLGLWMWSLKSDPSANSTPIHSDGACFFPLTQVYLPDKLRRIVCWDKAPTDLGLPLWLPSSLPDARESSIVGRRDDFTPYPTWRLDQSGFEAWHEADSNTWNQDNVRLFGWSALESMPVGAEPTTHKVWTMPTDCTLLSLCSQELFAVFVAGLMQAIPDIGHIQSTPLEDRLTSPLLLQLAEIFLDAELGSATEALLCVLPPMLSREVRAGRTPLWHAARAGILWAVNVSYETFKFDITLADQNGRQPLWQAASNGHVEVVKFLLQQGAKPMATDSDGVTALSEAAAKGHKAIVQLILQRAGPDDKDPDYTDKHGNTALGRAVQAGHKAVIELLLQEGATELGHRKDELLRQARSTIDEATVDILRAHTERNEIWSAGYGRTENDGAKIHSVKLYRQAYTATLGRFLKQVRSAEEEWRGPIRIAIVATGADIGALMSERNKRGRWETQKSFVDTEAYVDVSGYGTRLAALVASYAPHADIYTAKVTEGGPHKGEEPQKMPPKHLDNIAEAIDWAVMGMNVDIILVPFALTSTHKGIHRSLRRASMKSKIVFAGADRVSMWKRRCYPSSSQHVIGIHGADGEGIVDGASAAPLTDALNFSAPGICHGFGKPDGEVLSGSQYAAAVAAGTAASFLEFVRFKHVLSPGENPNSRLFSREGIEMILELLSTEENGYRFIQAGKMLRQYRTDEDLCAMIKTKMEGLGL